MEKDIRNYLNIVEADLKRGIATELTHRSSLEVLLESYKDSIQASSDPKHIGCGAPDFIVERRKVPLGYVETKDVGVDLDRIEKTDQMKRYLPALNNLILTDYLEFRWYVNGKERLRVKAAEVGKNNRLIIHDENVNQTAKLLQGFFEVEVPMLFTAKDLAQRMAHMAHFMRDLILADLNNETDEKGALHRQYNAFKEYLLPNLSIPEFADLYAQTMAYGLFAARLSMPDGQTFNRAIAYQYLGTNKFLRRLFLDVGEELDGSIIASYLDDLAALLNRANFNEILKDFCKRTRTEDPVVHFYETFLAAYDPKLRESRGVYYTPGPVVQFIVNSVDWILREKFGKPLGLADPEVNILDPAAGTGTFLYFVLRLVHERMRERGQLGQWQDYVHNHLLPRIFGFELLMAPYVMSHLKLGLQLKEELGYAWQKDDQLKVYMTNTLDEGVTKSEMLDGLAHYITDEANSAAVVKKETPIMVVMGNPPYSGHSANASKDANGKPNFIGKLLKDYYFVDGAPLGEKNPKWLQDDYVKFIRFAQYRIEKTGYGILAFVTNHGYLDNPTFRGMRQSLMKTFDDIFILDLHGNSKKKEIVPDGGKDENVFDIQQGVAIVLAIKSLETQPINNEKYVKYSSIWGSRLNKYTELVNNDLSKINWEKNYPLKPYYLFTSQNGLLRDEYESFIKITDAFPITRMGITSGDDSFIYDWSKDEFIRKINQVLHTKVLKKSQVRKKILSNISPNHFKLIYPALYRAFDKRLILFSSDIIWRPVEEIGNQFIKGFNFGLITIRRSREGLNGNIFVTDTITDKCAISSVDNCHISPLYINNDFGQDKFYLFSNIKADRVPNLSTDFISEIECPTG